MNFPKVIFLDAVGTLFGVRGSVGQIYSELAQLFNVETDPEAVNKAFFQSFRAAPPMAFPGVNMTEIPGQEYAWWQAIAVQTFRQVGVYDQFSDFSQFFDVLYAHFATAEPWFVYPDTWTTLKYWRSNDVALGIVSNFDSRIHAVLPSLGIAEFFDSVTISTEVGVAKPDADVFLSALQKHNCPPTSAWHIGDSFTEDYEGAKAVGMRGIWLKRHLRQ